VSAGQSPALGSYPVRPALDRSKAITPARAFAPLSFPAIARATALCGPLKTVSATLLGEARQSSAHRRSLAAHVRARPPRFGGCPLHCPYVTALGTARQAWRQRARSTKMKLQRSRRGVHIDRRKARRLAIAPSLYWFLRSLQLPPSRLRSPILFSIASCSIIQTIRLLSSRNMWPARPAAGRPATHLMTTRGGLTGGGRRQTRPAHESPNDEASSDFRCNAEAMVAAGGERHRCERPGSRYRDGRSLCPRCQALKTVRYFAPACREVARVRRPR
jgi:hypothetical protein